ncbi:MAG: 50S ribosomal protein L10 [Alphaproteobacteria bacterium]|nr:50S ribosomal protein L10 [Alphaproteobacteria bacterium]
MGGAPFVVLLEYRGASVAESADLRRKLEKSGLRMEIVKNTLAKRAIAGTDKEVLNESLQRHDQRGPLRRGSDRLRQGGQGRDRSQGRDHGQGWVLRGHRAGPRRRQGCRQPPEP